MKRRICKTKELDQVYRMYPSREAYERYMHAYADPFLTNCVAAVLTAHEEVTVLADWVTILHVRREKGVWTKEVRTYPARGVTLYPGRQRVRIVQKDGRPLYARRANITMEYRGLPVSVDVILRSQYS